MCRVKGCHRPVFARRLCGFHALQGHYRAEAVPGVGLTASRVPRPPAVVLLREEGERLPSGSRQWPPPARPIPRP